MSSFHLLSHDKCELEVEKLLLQLFHAWPDGVLLDTDLYSHSVSQY